MLIVVVSGKGGSGKTTTAMNVAGAINEIDRQGEKCGTNDPFALTVVDADTGASLTESFGFLADGSQAYDLFMGSPDLDGLAVETPEGIKLIPGTPQIGSLIAADFDGCAAHLHRISRNRHILIDTHNGLDLVCTRAALRAADIVIVPAQPEPKSWKRSLTDVIVALEVVPNFGETSFTA